MTEQNWEVVKDEFPVPCDHPSCALIHRRFFTLGVNTESYWQTVELPNGGTKRVWVRGFHEVMRKQWLLLLDGERYGDVYDTKREAVAERDRLRAREETS